MLEFHKSKISSVRYTTKVREKYRFSTNFIGTCTMSAHTRNAKLTSAPKLTNIVQIFDLAIIPDLCCYRVFDHNFESFEARTRCFLFLFFHVTCLALHLR